MEYLNEALEIVKETEKNNLKAEIIQKLIFAITDAENLSDYDEKKAEMTFQILGIALDGCMKSLYPEKIREDINYIETPVETETSDFQDKQLSPEEVKIAEEKYNG